jgi:hypothetical protein
MNTKNKQKLIEGYNKLKKTIIPRWDKVAKKEDKIMTNANINRLMSNEIEELRIYISKLKSLGTRIINHE